ncbi:MAG: hypothetical protein KatS3mg043_0156 [Rhodothermaceae bacterium]|nr:MAG: hypothetical protein KatS3mg043_0156 [Rhodothermaceae bacterium]
MAPAAGRFHRSDGGPARADVRLQVQVEDRLPVVVRRLDEGFAAVPAGIADEDVEAAVALERGVDKPPGSVRCGDVQRQRQDFAAVALDRAGHPAQGLLPPRTDHQPASFGRKRPCDPLADAPAGTGDDGHFAFEPEIHTRCVPFR